MFNSAYEYFKKKKENIDDAKDSNGYAKIHYLARDNDHESLKELLKNENNIDIDLLTEEGESAVYLACLNGSVNALKLLIEKYACVNHYIYKFFTTPLHVACIKGNKECVTLVLKRCTNVSATDNQDQNAAHYLAQSNADTKTKITILEQLIKKGIDLTQKSKDKEGKEWLAWELVKNDEKFALIMKNKTLGIKENNLENSIDELYDNYLNKNILEIKKIKKN